MANDPATLDEAEAQSAEPPAATDSADDPQKTKYENSLRREPYDFARCTVTLTLQLMADDGDPAGRPVLIGAQDHAFPPTVRIARLSELALPPLLRELLQEHAQRMGEREQAHQAEVEGRRTASTRRSPAPVKAGKSDKKVKLTDLPAPTPPAAPTAAAALPSDEPQQSVMF